MWGGAWKYGHEMGMVGEAWATWGSQEGWRERPVVPVGEDSAKARGGAWAAPPPTRLDWSPGSLCDGGDNDTCGTVSFTYAFCLLAHFPEQPLHAKLTF